MKTRSHRKNMLKKRASGILCHISSLPSAYGVGDFGPQAYKFADFLVRAKQSFWQMLPLNRPAIEIPHSPYCCLSAFGGDVLFISPEMLYQQGLLTKEQIMHRPAAAGQRVDYKRVITFKKKLLHLAYENFKVKKARSAYERF